jgi:hypothetical protein
MPPDVRCRFAARHRGNAPFVDAPFKSSERPYRQASSGGHIVVRAGCSHPFTQKDTFVSQESDAAGPSRA